VQKVLSVAAARPAHIMREDGRVFWMLNLVVHEIHKKGRKLRLHRSMFIFVFTDKPKPKYLYFSEWLLSYTNTTIYSEDKIHIRRHKETGKS